jgi:hypothetical protein
MAKKKQDPKPYPTDREAAIGAQTGSKPGNLEEQAHLQDRAADPETPLEQLEGSVEGTQPIPPEPEPNFVQKAAAALTPGGYCDFCKGPGLPDPRGTHKCARCRMHRIRPIEDEEPAE